MDWLIEKGIRLNICPTSNIRLGRVKDIMSHPMRTLYDHGVDVTINTDDMTIFGNNASDEYLTLFRSGLFTGAELDDIRLAGLTDYRSA
jgi:adenosine deaminase